MRLGIRLRVVVFAVLVAMVALPAGSASAHTMSSTFSIGGELWGYCGYRNGGWTMAIQASLKTHFINIGSYGPWGNGIDGSWGSATDSGVKHWQSLHGLSQDGCVGSGTWNNSMAKTGTSSSAHRYTIGAIGSGFYFGIKNHNSPSSSSYREALFADPAGNSNSIAVEIRYAGSATVGSVSQWDCRWVQHNTNGAPCR